MKVRAKATFETKQDPSAVRNDTTIIHGYHRWSPERASHAMCSPPTDTNINGVPINCHNAWEGMLSGGGGACAAHFDLTVPDLMRAFTGART